MSVKKKSEFAKQPTGDKVILIVGYAILGLFLVAIIFPVIYIILSSFNLLQCQTRTPTAAWFLPLLQNIIQPIADNGLRSALEIRNDRHKPPFIQIFSLDADNIFM